ncbi:MAG: MurR/RpiR family transcriptional regulator [Streptococcaceae bacterium]|jgi:DNA-binding MurR/RpiR family transcriptional regulator|nr:MurR/RpiR family transcriptional regulator [Streptococcaceae bacterium]
MFDVESMVKLNELEHFAFNYLVKMGDRAAGMTVREVAKESHVSTATIIRMAEKLGFKGWAELKYFLKSSGDPLGKVNSNYESVFTLDLFFKYLSSQPTLLLISKVVEEIRSAEFTLFLGMGTSDTLAQYGCRYFNNLGLSAFCMTDIYRPVQFNEFQNKLAIALSVSGETLQVLEKSLEIQKTGAKLVAITNNSSSTLAKMADYNFSYNMLDERAIQEEHIQLTTQLPVLAILETLARQAYQDSTRE